MTTQNSFSGAVCVATLLLLLLGLAAEASADTSLFNRAEAQKLSTESGIDLGPKSSEIRYDNRMIRAAEIAMKRAQANSTERCWRYVKNALVDAQLVDSRPTTVYAKEAAAELTNKYGFTKLEGVTSPLEAPIGSVLVYGGKGAGHVEFRTAFGFVSDFWSLIPSRRPLVGVYVKEPNRS